MKKNLTKAESLQFLSKYQKFLNIEIHDFFFIDKNNFKLKENLILKKIQKKFKKKKKIKVLKRFTRKLNKKYNVILYLHVLEHIKNDYQEINEAVKKLKKSGFLIILAPAHSKMYSNLDKIVGHYRRYELDFFKTKFKSIEQISLKYLDSSGYMLYFLNKLLFKNEKYPSKFKIFIWDKFFTPVSLILDFIFQYKIGKCILAIYKKT